MRAKEDSMSDKSEEVSKEKLKECKGGEVAEDTPRQSPKYHDPEKLEPRANKDTLETKSNEGESFKPRPKSKSTVEPVIKKKEKDTGDSLRKRLGFSPSVKRRSISPRSTRI